MSTTTRDKLALARAILVRKEPYWASAAWKLTLTIVKKEDWPPDSGGEIASDEFGRVIVNEDLIERCDIVQLAHHLCHEIGHLVRGHFQRAKGRDPRAWNVAGDAAMAADINAAWPRRGYPGITPQTLNMPEGLIAEEYYARLPVVKLQVCCGSAAGNKHPAEGLLPPLPGDKQAEREGLMVTARVEVAMAVRAENKAKPGSVPQSLVRWAEETMAPSVTPWQKILARQIRGVFAKAGMSNYTYDRPSRRQPRGSRIVLPTMRDYRPTVTVVIDTSGSMGNALLGECVREVPAIAKAAGAVVDVLPWDMTGKRIRNVASAHQIKDKLEGGGGTDMGAAVAEASKDGPTAVVVLTDGETGWGAPPPRGTRLIVCVPKGGPATPEWAVRVEVFEA